jgi:hypothetical protein
MESIKRKAERLKLKAFCVMFCFGLCAFSFQPAKAQTFAEWFSQGKTQIKYLEQQIAALNAFESQVRQGYQMLKNEWGAIANFKDGELGLHQTYYTSLSNVNPAVKNSTDITTITAEQQSISSQLSNIAGLNGLMPSEQTYIQAVAQNVISECAKDLTDLQTVLTPGQLVMSDDERIQRISKLTTAIKDKYVFTCNFCNQVKILAAQRSQGNNEIQTERSLYGIN